VARPHTVDNVVSVEGVLGVKIQQVVIGSCTNGRVDDLAAAARILKGKKVAQGVRMLVFPASWQIYRECMREGYLADLVEAGAVIMNRAAAAASGSSGCARGRDVALSTTNRNFLAGWVIQSPSLPLLARGGRRQCFDRDDYRPKTVRTP